MTTHNGTATSMMSVHDAVIRTLSAAPIEITLTDVVDKLAETGFKAVDVKAAVWQLIDNKTVEMTSQRTLRCKIQSSCRAATA